MSKNLALVTLIVSDYDEAIQWFIDKLNFILIEDTKMSEEKRWVVVAPSEGNACNILLAKASNPDQQSRVGNQTGGRVFLFLYTDDFHRDYDQMISQGVEFVRGPVTEPYGIVGVFKDLYGNLWDFIQPSIARRES